MAVFGEASLARLIIELLCSPPCYSDCYPCQRLELELLEALCIGFLRCCGVIAGRDDAGGLCTRCGQPVPVHQVAFHRLDASRTRYFKLLRIHYRARVDNENEAGIRVGAAEEAMGTSTDEMAKKVYMNHLYSLDQRCRMYEDHELDLEWAPTPTP